jgi:Ca-activated chloride channel family protein
MHIEPADVPPRNLTFLLDVSGSMQPANKLGLVKRAMTEFTRQLRPQDHVAIVVYAGASGLVLPPTSGEDPQRIVDALGRLQAGGSTNGGDGISLAYQTARRHFDSEGINRVILATDGDWNVGTTNRSDLVDLIERERESGVFLTVLGVGTGNLKDATMEALADTGNGHYAYLDDITEARKVLIEESGGTLFTIAKDVKIQVEWNPARVLAYRLIGYENRRLADEDFNDDSRDAGEIGAGHDVTALYEIVPSGGEATLREVDPLRYQPKRVTDTPDGSASRELLTVKLRYKAPNADRSTLVTRHLIDDPNDVRRASDDLRFASAVASFGMLLRGSEHRGHASWTMTSELARGAIGNDAGGYRAEFVRLVEIARSLSPDPGLHGEVARVN